jgi:SynChlorMet cassette protein ScmD
MLSDVIIGKDPRVVLREELDQWGILFNPDTSEVVSINAMGIDIWKLIDGTCRMQYIFDTIQTQYDQVPSEAQEQVNDFINELIKRGFIKKLSEEEKEKP